MRKPIFAVVLTNYTFLFLHKLFAGIVAVDVLFAAVLICKKRTSITKQLTVTSI